MLSIPLVVHSDLFCLLILRVIDICLLGCSSCKVILIHSKSSPRFTQSPILDAQPSNCIQPTDLESNAMAGVLTLESDVAALSIRPSSSTIIRLLPKTEAYTASSAPRHSWPPLAPCPDPPAHDTRPCVGLGFRLQLVCPFKNLHPPTHPPLFHMSLQRAPQTMSKMCGKS